MARRKAAATADDILADHSPQVRALVDELRRVILQTVPEAVETPIRGWHSLNFHHPTAGYFCGLFPRGEAVQMAFEFGALLPDPAGLLTGDGLQVRYVAIRRRQDIRVRALKQLLRAAINLPEPREVKMALVQAKARPVAARSPAKR